MIKRSDIVIMNECISFLEVGMPWNDVIKYYHETLYKIKSSMNHELDIHWTESHILKLLRVAFNQPGGIEEYLGDLFRRKIKFDDFVNSLKW